MTCLRWIPRRCSNVAGVALVFAALCLLSGCWVSSVNGLIEGDFLHSDPDVTVDQRLGGTWEVTSDSCTTTLAITLDGQAYDLAATSQGEQCNKQEKPDFSTAQLVKLDNHLFLDVSPRADDICAMCLPLHQIFLTTSDKDLLSLAPIDSEWLKKAVEQKTVALATMPENTDLMTASAKDLKAFCRKYADNPHVFVPMPEFVFKRKINAVPQP
jgi:hypothetical protein